jgi:hypothetical protein
MSIPKIVFVGGFLGGGEDHAHFESGAKLGNARPARSPDHE